MLRKTDLRRPLQRGQLLAPAGQGQFPILIEVVFQLSTGHVEDPQLVFVLCLEFLPSLLEFDAVHLVKYRFPLRILLCIEQKVAQFSHAAVTLI